LRTDDLVEEALKSNPDRSDDDVAALKESVKRPLVELPKDHGAIFGARDAARAGLPVVEVDPRSDQWRLVWRLWAKYYVLNARVYEGRKASRIIPYF
jgi:hypothetical protein